LQFDPSEFLQDSSFKERRIYLRGQLRFPKSQPNGPQYEVSGFTVAVSERSRDDLPGQIEEAIEFLSRNHSELERLGRSPGIEEVRLDFPYHLRVDGENILAQFDYLPPRLLLLAGTLGIGIELSLYPGPGQEEGSERNSVARSR
jgi:hypothetical protein